MGDSVDSSRFFVRSYLSLVRKNSVTHAHGLTAAMGIGGGSRQCRRKCHRIWDLRQQKNFCCKVFYKVLYYVHSPSLCSEV